MKNKVPLRGGHLVLRQAVRVFSGRTRGKIGEILQELCRQRGVELLEGHAMPDHIHMVLSIPPRCSVANTVGFLKGKIAVRVHRELLRHRRMTDLHFWADGYCVSMIGLDEKTIRRSVREQEQRDRNLDQQEFDFD